MPKNLLEVAIFDPNVTVPVDTEPRNANSVEVAFQQLANRTTALVDRVGGPDGSSEWIYPTPRARTRIISAFMLGKTSQQTAAGNNAWYAPIFGANLGNEFQSLVNFAPLLVDLNALLPDGSTLTSVRALVVPGAARTAQTSVPGDNGRMFVGLHRVTPDFSAPLSAPAYTGPTGASEDDGTTSRQLLSTGTVAEVIDKSTSFLYWKLLAGDSAGTGGTRDTVEAIEINYTDPGPRNF